MPKKGDETQNDIFLTMTGRRLQIPLFGLLVSMSCASLLLSDTRVSAAPTDPLPVTVAPQDPHIRYVGRFDTRQPSGPRCAWSASRVELRFSGSTLNVVLDDTGDDAYEVFVDGKPASVLTVQKGKGVYSLLKDRGTTRGKQAHTVALIKRTEPLVGTTQFLGFQLAAGARILSLPARSPRRLEVIGDSISCGFGNEAKDQNEHFAAATENAALSYGAVAARALGAEYTCVAWSGRTLWPTNTMPEIYGLTLPADPTSRWNFSHSVPDAIVINLGTNDFGHGNPDRKLWTDAYESFIARIRKNAPRATIYCASGPMMSDSWPPGQHALTTLNSYLSDVVSAEHSHGDTNVHLLLFTPQSPENGYGAAWHPSLKTHAIMATVLTKTLSSDLGWKHL